MLDAKLNIDTDAETQPEPNSALHTPNSALPRRSTSKIARLPANVRQTINTMLNDGHSYPAIVARLTELGHPEITKQNLSSWSTTGFRQWLAEQQRLDEINAETDSVAALLKDHDPSTTLNAVGTGSVLNNPTWNAEQLCGLGLRREVKFKAENVRESCSGSREWVAIFRQESVETFTV